ncbi:MAG: hypothetical protein QY331_13020 [Melioribacteraceae bacterium]|jgi:hypothetical protein|nr:hypothetical protein [Melioribacteraceae bacterium]WKZ68874.1 MAG: hypothetical protein QY331_13020 [Melioribacteraceae bacterium]
MSTQKKNQLNTDKTTDFSFYVMVGALGIGFLVSIGFVIFSLF